MTQQHPITPPPELLKQWEDDWYEEREHADVLLVNAYAAGALAGADAELEACCRWISDDAEALRIARRPKPPSLKEQALDVLKDLANGIETADSWAVIQSALEQLDD